MAPGLARHDSTSTYPGIATHVPPQGEKPTVYLVDDFHPEAISHARSLFNVVLPMDLEMKNWKENAEYLLVKSSSLPASEIQTARKLRAIGKQGVGIDRIDAAACEQAGIKIFNTPGVNANAVAELVLALTMAVARDIGSIQVRQSRGQSVHKETCSGLILSRKTLGLIGMGNIGKAVARMFRGAFNANVVAYDPFLPTGAWDDLPHKRAQTVAEVLKEADVLSIHVPLTPETKDLVNLETMKTMKTNAIIINAARGGIINEGDLCTALSEGLVWGAGLDCHEQEPPTKEKYFKLWSHPRVVSTPHIGAATSQTQVETAKAAVDRLYEFSMQQ